jgi:hypothetical protein
VTPSTLARTALLFGPGLAPAAARKGDEESALPFLMT